MLNFFFQYIVPALAKLFYFILAFIVASVLGLLAYIEALAGR